MSFDGAVQISGVYNTDPLASELEDYSKFTGNFPQEPIHLYVDGPPESGREGVGAKIWVRGTVANERIGQLNSVAVRVNGRIYPLGYSFGGDPPLDFAFSRTINPSQQGGSLDGATIELLVDDAVVSNMTAPASLDGELFDANFGEVTLDGSCSACSENSCTPGKFIPRLSNNSLGSIQLGNATGSSGEMQLRINPDELLDGAVKADSLDYVGNQTGSVETIDSAGEGHRQFVSPNGLTDIVDNADGSGNYTNTEIKLYQGSGTKSGGYYSGSSLIKTIRFEHAFTPATGFPPEEAGTDTVTVSEIEAVGTKTTSIEYDRAAKKRSLVTDGGSKKESRISTVSGNMRTVVSEVRSGDDTLLKKTSRVYTTYVWGEALTSETEDPDGDARTTTWTYQTDSGAPGYKQVTSMTNPDGYWERYTYYSGGRRQKVISQYLGAATGATEANSRVVTTTYDGDNRTEIETLMGQEVARRYILRSSSGSTTTEQTKVCTIAEASINDPTNLVTTAIYRNDGSDVTNPDGTLVKTTTSADGLTTTVENGAASSGNVVDGTKTEIVKDARGNELQRTVWDVASSTMILQNIATVTDAFGRPTTITHLNGTSESKTYGCCGLDQWTDIEGITTTYGHDDFGNVNSESRAGITVGRQYDALGRLRVLTRTGSDSVAITTGGSDYNLAGKEILRHSILGDITIEDVPNEDGTWTQTETDPGGVTHIRKRTSDSLLLELSGTAEHPLSYAYGVDDGVRSIKEIRVGDEGATTEWVQRKFDAAGRVTTKIYADNAHADYGYNDNGQLISETDPDGVVTLHGYNSRGELVTTTLDINRNGLVDPGEPSTTTTRSVVSGKLRTAITQAGDSGPVNVSTVDQGITDLNRIETNYGLSTSVAVAVSSGSHTETFTLPDESTLVRSFSDGRLASEVYSGGGETARLLSYQYDGRGRLWKLTDGRTGTTTYTYYDTDLLHTISKDGKQTTYAYNALGQRTDEALPGSRTVTRDYKPTGEIISVSGNAEYSVSYLYDPQGRITSMTTATGTTTWHYDPQRGWLDTKKDAAEQPVGYTYTSAARPETRTWARGVITTYGYDNGGRLHTITYSDGTPSLTYGYDPRGQVNSVIDAAGTHTIVHAVTGALQSDSIAAGLLSGVVVSNGFDSLLRKSGFQALRNSTSMVSYDWGYDGLSRLQTVTSGTDSASYVYHSNSSLVHTLTFDRSSTTRLTTSKEFDDFDRVASISSQPSAGDPVGVSFSYNDAGKRETATFPDETYWSYGYNTRGEVTSGAKKLATDDTELSGYQFGYNFDGIGNRLSTTRGERSSTYTPDELNQYSSRTVPGYVNVLGKAANSADVTVNSQEATRQGDGFFHEELPISNSSSAAYLATTVYASNNLDEATFSGHLFVPATPEGFSYDLDGNLLEDGRWNYTWDAENRLISMVTRTDVAAIGAPRQRLTFKYDYAGRRISKKADDWVTDRFNERFTLFFAYDGWNPAAEWVKGGGGIPLRSYVWGSDLSGGSAAGGIGGVLFIHQLPEEKTFSVAYDGNGNVTNLYDMADGSSVATYEYGPFGETLRSTGLFARVNPLRFSTKYQDNESDLLYYGNRYYTADLGRWLNRDPIGEQGGMNLYGMVRNDPVGLVDPLGLEITYYYAQPGSNILTPSGVVPYLNGENLGESLVAGLYNTVPLVDNSLFSVLSAANELFNGAVDLSMWAAQQAGASPAEQQLIGNAATVGTFFLGGAEAKLGKLECLAPKTAGQLGREGEAAIEATTGLSKNTESFMVNGRTRIPDFITARDSAGFPTSLIESKNVQYQSLTLQLRDYADLVGSGGRVDIALPQGARVSTPLQNAFDNPNNPLFRIDLP